MQINANLTQPALVYAQSIPWVDSPLPGVQRRMLERDGGEVARATSLVRYSSNSYFSAHVHDGGEEFLVLEGIFSDEYGDYRPGFYVRNPAGSKHTPYSKQGCTIFVKLRQMDLADRTRVVVDTQAQLWIPGNSPGIEVMPLYTYSSEQVTLERWRPNTKGEQEIHRGGIEILVLEGTLEDERGQYSQYTWIRYPADSVHSPQSQDGCILYVKRGHLPQ